MNKCEGWFFVKGLLIIYVLLWFVNRFVVIVVVLVFVCFVAVLDCSVCCILLAVKVGSSMLFCINISCLWFKFCVCSLLVNVVWLKIGNLSNWNWFILFRLFCGRCGKG